MALSTLITIYLTIGVVYGAFLIFKIIPGKGLSKLCEEEGIQGEFYRFLVVTTALCTLMLLWPIGVTKVINKYIKNR